MPEAFRPLFDDRADEPPTKPEELLRLEQGFREVLQERQDDRPASSFFSDPGMPAGPDDLNSIVADAFAAAGSGHAAVQAAAPPVLAASEQQIRPSPDALDVAEARRADPAPVASGAHDARYPHLSGEHRGLIDQAITYVAAQRDHSELTVRKNKNALRRLANDLGARGQAIDLKNHRSLVDHVNASFPKNAGMKRALNVLRAYHERTGYSALYPHLSGEHRGLIDQAITRVAAQKHYKANTVGAFTNALYRLANDLGARGQAIDLKNHQSLADHVNALFPKNRDMKKALDVLRAYHERPGYSARYPHLSGEHRGLIDQAITHVAAQKHYSENTVGAYTNALRRLVNDLGARGQAIDLTNHQSLVDHVNAFFPKNDTMKLALDVLRVYHEAGKLRAPEPASPATARLSDTYRGVPLVDLTTSSDAQIGAFPSGSSNLPEGAVLGAAELLSDAHIHRDYRLLEQDLQEARPALAARTRLVDAMVAHQLRRHDVDVQARLLSIYHQNDAPADFVFLPVNSADPMDPAPDPQRINHWSLLLVDRRDPERAVAYHYDSIQHNGQGSNDALARELATRLDATTLVTPAMAQQNNGVDCGVFVVDGTRELVYRLATEERPDQQRPLHLNYLVADRQALQNRLREERLPHELAAIPVEAFGAAGSQVQYAVLQEQQARQVAPAPFERHLGKTRETQDELTSTARYPHLSGEHRGLIDQAITYVAAQRGYSALTAQKYIYALRRLANDLGAHGQAIDLTNHQSLVDHVKAFFPKDDGSMKQALNVLRAYHERPGYSATAGRPAPYSAPYPHLSGEHRGLIDQAITHVAAQRDYSASTVGTYRSALCRLVNDLGARGQAIDLKNHRSLVDHVNAFFPKNDSMKWALDVLRVYHEAGKLRAPEPASPATARLSDTYRGVPLVDLTTSSDAQIGAFPSGSSNLPEGAVLGAAELLSDAHIHRDYRLLEQDLQEAHPALATRTRLVDAMVAHQLRRHDVDVQARLLSIYHQNDAPADFVFLPVNSADPMDPAPDPQRINHWSLLLVDRRDPERAVAYHYDSIQHNGQGSNDALARELATRLDATTLVTPAMAQQNNGVDCGVFVVDGTRELVYRLATEERPDQQRPLHLNYLVADRQALQNRLREERLPHELAAIPAEAFGAAGSQVQYAVLQEQQARQVAPAPFERHLGKTREAQDELTSTLDRSHLVNSGDVIINNEHYTALLRPAKRQRTDNPQSLAMGRQQLSEATTTSISQPSDQARADLIASFRSRERSAGR
ncbi:C48 family peptidase (plasmid) [Sinorhizobium garamanticum]|uniref:C48 family peptidase n=1 Tax=Sinorhizobium garamanticum TaxID=680247 RepID=A0ABY8DQ89_9HYPH|nr:Ulp1 family isopeptidase [Sinorhizobium garamanticum]WEX91832.1 C48 family peptidase [Sinorhizobium garamanticum]